MSYWYGKVMEIYWTTAKTNKTQVTETIIPLPIRYDYSCGIRQDVWLDIQWYYRRVDLEDKDVEYDFPSWCFAEPLTVSSLSSLAACVGDYELVLSDHKSVVDMHCVEGVLSIISACPDHPSDMNMFLCTAAHANIVRYDEGDLSQPQIPPATLYHRWNISMQFTTRRNLELQQVNIEVSTISIWSSRLRS
jgi:hypothetical protein